MKFINMDINSSGNVSEEKEIMYSKVVQNYSFNKEADDENNTTKMHGLGEDVMATTAVMPVY